MCSFGVITTSLFLHFFLISNKLGRHGSVFKFSNVLRHFALLFILSFDRWIDAIFRFIHVWLPHIFFFLLFFYSRLLYQNLNTSERRTKHKHAQRNKSFCLQIICRAQYVLFVSDCAQWRHGYLFRWLSVQIFTMLTLKYVHTNHTDDN